MTTHFDVNRLAKSVGKLPGQPKTSIPMSGLRIGLVNNMPDGALLATEQQFSELVTQATDGCVTLQLYYLPSLSRGEAAMRMLRERYRPISDLYHSGIDALIVTGNEPRAAKLDEEPYWPEMAALIDWACDNTASTFWSCLAAHAAVLHLDRIERRRLPSKRSGAFTCQSVGDALPNSLVVCHSRLNEVPKDALEKAGYRILSQSERGEVDVFMKTMPSQFLFLQGHPEYGALSLAREYRRDVERYLNSVRDDYPEMPENYFDAGSASDYQKFRNRAQKLRAPKMIEDFPNAYLRPELSANMAKSAAAIFAFWIEKILEGVAAKRLEPPKPI